jgi:hypothetical protein
MSSVPGLVQGSGLRFQRFGDQRHEFMRVEGLRFLMDHA